MRRRKIFALAAGAFAWPLAAAAQRQAMPVIGLLGAQSPGPFAPFVAALLSGLSETGFVEGRNLSIEYRWAESRYDRLPGLAADLVRRKVDLIVTTGGPASALAAKRATATIPIVFTAVGDPVANGLVASLARPGGNVTGFSVLVIALVAKRLELLAELVPLAKTIALLVNPNSPLSGRIIADAQRAARAKGVQLGVLRAVSKTGIDAAFVSLARRHVEALLVGPDPLFNGRRGQLVALASRDRVPAIYEFREFVDAGGLMSYGPSLVSVNRQAGIYAGRILRGEKPADLPVQQPTKFELVINLKTAKALGLTVPPILLAQADEVIQ